MITVYEIKANGFHGVNKEVDPKQGVGTNWTYTPPPGAGPHKWENSQWVPYAEEHPTFMPGPDYEAMGASIRDERTQRIAATDWTQGKDIPDEVSTLWAPYRQSLRDITSQEEFPLSVQWPVEP